MKLHLRLMATLVMGTLLAIFVYQAYWLVGLHHTLLTKQKSDIIEAMRKADFEEMMGRISVLHNDTATRVDTVGVSISGSPQGMNSMVSYSHKKGDKNKTTEHSLSHSTRLPATSNQEITLSSMLGDKERFLQFASYVQNGLHSALDSKSTPDINRYDALLTHNLDSLGVSMPHRLLYVRGNHHLLQSVGAKDIHYTDTFRIAVNPETDTRYVLLTTSLSHAVLAQMTGILVASLLILIVLGLVFWYLIRTMIQMHTLDEMKSDFTNNMTHELKTPIAVAYAANDALLNYDALYDKEKMKRYLTASQQQLKKLSMMVEQILSMSMERRKQMKLHLEQVNVAETVGQVVSQQQLKADKPIHITQDIPEQLTLYTDRTHLTNILNNLVDNAIKYSQNDANIHIKGWRHGSSVMLTVADRGIGIGKEALNHIFDKFYREPHGNRHEVKGYGLGLYYVKTMTERLGGKVSVESKQGTGTTFKLTYYEQD